MQNAIAEAPQKNAKQQPRMPKVGQQVYNRDDMTAGIVTHTFPAVTRGPVTARPLVLYKDCFNQTRQAYLEELEWEEAPPAAAGTASVKMLEAADEHHLDPHDPETPRIDMMELLWQAQGLLQTAADLSDDGCPMEIGRVTTNTYDAAEAKMLYDQVNEVCVQIAKLMNNAMMNAATRLHDSKTNG